MRMLCLLIILLFSGCAFIRCGDSAYCEYGYYKYGCTGSDKCFEKKKQECLKAGNTWTSTVMGDGFEYEHCEEK